MSPLAKRCIKQMEKFADGRKVIIVTFSDLSRYIHLQPYILEKYKKGMISKTHLSDIVRTNLMAKYGGVYMDATILQKAPMPKEWFDLDFYTFKVNNIPYSYTNISNAQRCVFFFICKKNNPLMLALSDLWGAYWMKFDYLIDYFLVDYMWNLCYVHIPEVKKELDAVPESDKEVFRWLFGGGKDLSEKCTEIQYRQMIKDFRSPLLKMSAKAFVQIPDRLPTGELTLKGCIIKYDI